MAMRRSTKMQLARAAREESRQLPGRKMEIEYERWGEPENRYDGQPRNRYDSRPSSNWREPTRMEHQAPEYRYPMSPRMEGMGYEAESRFRDRRGREHYNNGRFAPMRGAYAPYGPYGEEEGPFGRNEGGAEMREIGFNSNWGGNMRMGSDASIPRYNEMEYMPGKQGMMGGYMAEHQHRKLDEQTAMEWVRGMKNEDGSQSPHWTMEQVKQVTKQKGLDKEIEPVEMFAILNALYSDYDPIFKKHGVSNMEFYADMAKAWIKDKDAVPNKAMAYYECIVK